ncbi:hypothetical protein HK103_005716 [Boothiomyces macroporosus]|uniref:DH domain-containing protein n=1 Tax=Boothiomyces macroporosus TaxID=261099 RepID=A0AAD5Y541_9FUNG|nr:hypothetical protein HK103_005716 [Boothiomyces macroporosus]
MFHNTPESSKKKPLKIKALFNKKQPQVDIKATAYYDAKLIKPFRFTPQIDPGNSGLQAFITLVEDEKVYAADLNSTIEKLDSMEATNTVLFIKEYLTKIVAITNNLEKEIYPSYSDYLSIYVKFEKEWEEMVKSDQRIEFAFNNILYDLARPFQRLLEYRFFLHCIQKYHHGCDPAKCNIKTCKIKSKCNNANKEAIKLLNKLIACVSEVFGIKDNFEELSKWENFLQTSKCRAIGEQKDKPELYVANVNVEIRTKISQLPTILASEEFQVLPIAENVKLFSKKNNQLVLNTNVHGEDLNLHLLSDTLVITGKIDIKTNQLHLLYPPMPLTHISMEKHGFVENIYSLKLSPFCVIMIKCSDSERGKAFVELLAQQKEVQTGSKDMENREAIFDGLHTLDQIATNAVRKVYGISENDKFLLEPTELISSKANEKLCSMQCIPYIFRIEDTGSTWVKLSKCDLQLEKIEEKFMLSLFMCDTKKCVLSAAINSSSRVKRDSNQKRFHLSVFNDDIASQYLIQLGTKDKVDTILSQIENIIFQNITANYSLVSTKLFVCDLPEWIESGDCAFTHFNLGRYSSCLIRYNDSNWINFGKVSSYLVVNEIEEQEISVMLAIRSDINPLLTLLRLELIPELWSVRMESAQQLYLRVFAESGTLDYNLIMDGNKVNDIVELINQQSKLRETKVKKIAQENEMKSCSSKATEIGGLINTYLQSADLEKDETVVNLEETETLTQSSKVAQEEAALESIKDRFERNSKESIPDSIEEIITNYNEPKPKMIPSKSAPNLSKKVNGPYYSIKMQKIQTIPCKLQF